MSDDDCCDICGVDLDLVGSHYHCPNCLKTCSMMGHWDMEKHTYDCERHPNADSYEAYFQEE